MSDEARRGPGGRFLKKKAVDTDKIWGRNEDNTVGRVSKRWVDDDLRFYPVSVDVLREVTENAADGHDYVMLAVPEQHTNDGARGCLVLAGNEDTWWDHDTETDVWVGAGTTYRYAGDDDTEGDEE